MRIAAVNRRAIREQTTVAIGLVLQTHESGCLKGQWGRCQNLPFRLYFP